jgi:hypothetical protein
MYSHMLISLSIVSVVIRRQTIHVFIRIGMSINSFKSRSQPQFRTGFIILSGRAVLGSAIFYVFIFLFHCPWATILSLVHDKVMVSVVCNSLSWYGRSTIIVGHVDLIFT